MPHHTFEACRRGFPADPLATHYRWSVEDLAAAHFELPYRTAQVWAINARPPVRARALIGRADLPDGWNPAWLPP